MQTQVSCMKSRHATHPSTPQPPHSFSPPCNIRASDIRTSQGAASSNMAMSLGYCTARKSAQVLSFMSSSGVGLISALHPCFNGHEQKGGNIADCLWSPLLCTLLCMCQSIMTLWYPAMSKVSFSVAPNLSDPPIPNLLWFRDYM